jgi:carbamoyltransferase
MRVLGITTEGDSGAAIVEDGRIIAAVNEERLSRMKLVVGFPRLSIREVMELSGTEPDNLDGVIVAAHNGIFVDQLEPFSGWAQLDGNLSDNFVKRVAPHLSKYRSSFPFLETGYYALLAPTFWQRRKQIKRILLDEFQINIPVKFVDHHFAHITSAYFTSGFRDALVVSIDGGGDGRSSRVYAVRNGKFDHLHSVSAFNSLGNYYGYITHICGFKALKHEGKITGLAAYGEPRYVSLLQNFIDEVEGSFHNKGGVVFQRAVNEIERRLPKGWKREDLAASIQRHFEELVRRYIQFWVKKAGLNDVALAGGVFANVRVNEEVHNLPDVHRIFIHPHMSDGGLSVGAALSACVPGVLPQVMERARDPLKDVYFGRDLSEQDIQSAMRKFGLVPETLDSSLEEKIVDLLVQGYVVARAKGRMEYGPRALGNRSILYQPTDPSVNDWLNKNLRRTEFMPFAPSMLFEERERCFENVRGAEHPAEFMTITFHCTPWMQKSMQGVVHLDNTARPHLVRKDRNLSYYRIIEEFYRRTGLPTIINTSFNIHEEPIVSSADDCLRAFIEGNLDYIAIGRYLIKHPKEISHSLQPLEYMADNT